MSPKYCAGNVYNVQSSQFNEYGVHVVVEVLVVGVLIDILIYVRCMVSRHGPAVSKQYFSHEIWHFGI